MLRDLGRWHAKLVSDGTDYTLEDDSDEPYATLFCRCDLTINGTGALNVTANYCHGICSKDDLVVTGGTIDVISCCEGLEAEKVYVNGGDTSIVASDDAVNSSAADLSDSSDESEGANDNGAPGERGITVNGETPGKGGPAAGGSPVDGGSFPGGSKGGGNQGGAPDAGSSDCLIQINGGTLVLDSAGDAVDSNGSVEITGGTVLVNGPSSDGDGAFDYDSEAIVSGGTVLMIGSSRMAQSFSGGTQPFLCTANVSGSAGDTVAIVDASGNVIASITAAKQFGMVLASSPKFTEGGEYTLVIDGVLTNADAHGYTDFGTVSGGSSTSATASTTPSSSVGGMGSGPGAVGVAR